MSCRVTLSLPPSTGLVLSRGEQSGEELSIPAPDLEKTATGFRLTGWSVRGALQGGASVMELDLTLKCHGCALPGGSKDGIEIELVPGACVKLAGPSRVSTVNREALDPIQIRALDADGNICAACEENLQLVNCSEGLTLEGETTASLVGGVADFRGVVAQVARTRPEPFSLKVKGSRKLKSLAACIDLHLEPNRGPAALRWLPNPAHPPGVRLEEDGTVSVCLANSEVHLPALTLEVVNSEGKAVEIDPEALTLSLTPKAPRGRARAQKSTFTATPHQAIAQYSFLEVDVAEGDSAFLRNTGSYRGHVALEGMEFVTPLALTIERQPGPPSVIKVNPGVLPSVSPDSPPIELKLTVEDCLGNTRLEPVPVTLTADPPLPITAYYKGASIGPSTSITIEVGGCVDFRLAVDPSELESGPTQATQAMMTQARAPELSFIFGYNETGVATTCPVRYISPKQDARERQRLEVLAERLRTAQEGFKLREKEASGHQAKLRTLRKKAQAREAAVAKASSKAAERGAVTAKLHELEAAAGQANQAGAHRPCNLFLKNNQKLRNALQQREGEPVLRPLLGCVGELAQVEDERVGEAIARLLGTNMQILVVETQQDLVPIKAKFAGVSLVGLQTVQSKWAPDKLVDRRSPQHPLAKLAELPVGARYAVNEVHLDPGQLALNLRQRLWYFLLGHGLIFETAVQMNAHVAAKGIHNYNMIALDTMEIVRSSGIQSGGEGRPPVSQFQGVPYNERPGFAASAKLMASLKEKLAATEKHQQAAEQNQDELTEIQLEIEGAEEALRAHEAQAVEANTAGEREVTEVQAQMDTLQREKVTSAGMEVQEDEVEEVEVVEPRPKRRKAT